MHPQQRATAIAITLMIPGLLLAPSQAQVTPEIPTLDREVYLIDDGTPHYPAIPPLRTSADGRIGYDFKNKRLFLIRPESLAAPLLESAPGVTLLASTAGISLDPEDLHNLSGGAMRHGAVCDRGYVSTNCGGSRCPNPRPCGADDCYDVTLVTPVQDDSDPLNKKIELWSTDMTLQVSQPKTGSATLTVAQKQTPYRGPVHDMSTMFETMITADGRLIVGRVGGSLAGASGVDIVYAVAPLTSDPCDVDGWTQFKSVTLANSDPDMNGRYGFASYPLRDPTGALIPAGSDLRGTYPWIDRAGANLFFTSVHSNFWYRASSAQPFQTRYPSACLPGATPCIEPSNLNTTSNDEYDVDAYDELSDTRGVSVAGLWTKGKVVLLDGLINNIDYGMRIPSWKQRLAQLYQPGSDATGGGDGQVRIGLGRHNGGGGGIYPPGYVNNSTFIDSTESLFTAYSQLRPLTPRDVVWIVNTGHASDEVAFDDWVNPNALIVSEMVGAMSWSGGFSGRYNYFDGFTRTGGGWNATGFDGNQPVRVQNSATSVDSEWAVPPYGEVFGNPRLEPVALGGIHGKGLWLDGATGVRYSIPVQPRSVDTPFYVGLFVDPRFADDDQRRVLIQFPDQSRVDLQGLDRIVYVDQDGFDLQTYTLPGAKALAEHSWHHLGWLIDPGGTRVRLYRNGDPFATWNAGADQTLFKINAGHLFVGKVEGGQGAGFVGWIDEFKVFGESPNFEVICNHARGTLIEEPYIVQVQPPQQVLGMALAHSPIDSSTLPGQALDAAAATHTKTLWRRRCFHDYTVEQPGAHLQNLPPQARSVRESMLFPEGPIVWNQPRPDSSNNGFCLSCHVDSSLAPSLQVGALTADANGTWMVDDPRRQPSHPPVAVSGQIPADHYGPLLPATDLVEQGAQQDQWVFPD